MYCAKKKVERQIVTDSLRALHELENLFFENEMLMMETLKLYASTNLDFADCYLLARAVREGKGLKSLDIPLQKAYKKALFRQTKTI